MTSKNKKTTDCILKVWEAFADAPEDTEWHKVELREKTKLNWNTVVNAIEFLIAIGKIERVCTENMRYDKFRRIPEK